MSAFIRHYNAFIKVLQCFYRHYNAFKGTHQQTFIESLTKRLIFIDRVTNLINMLPFMFFF